MKKQFKFNLGNGENEGLMKKVGENSKSQSIKKKIVCVLLLVVMLFNTLLPNLMCLAYSLEENENNQAVVIEEENETSESQNSGESGVINDAQNEGETEEKTENEELRNPYYY